MAKRSEAWKDLEREVAEALKGTRVSRGDDFSRSDVDVVVADFPALAVDAKYRKSHAHHALLVGVEVKYCSEARLVPVLATKHHRQRGFNITIPGWHYAALLDQVRELQRLQRGVQEMILKDGKE